MSQISILKWMHEKLTQQQQKPPLIWFEEIQWNELKWLNQICLLLIAIKIHRETLDVYI